MTEAEWLDCTDPEKMLKFLRGKASDRKLRLFSNGCSERVTHPGVEGYMQMVVEFVVAEQPPLLLAFLAAKWGERMARKGAWQACRGRSDAKEAADAAQAAERHEQAA